MILQIQIVSVIRLTLLQKAEQIDMAHIWCHFMLCESQQGVDKLKTLSQTK